MDFHISLFKRLKFDPGVGVVILLTTFATWPLLRRPGLPTFTDADHHVYRTLEIILAWQQGVPYLRWAPDLFLGYGYPVFNYYAPLTYYLGAAYGFFFGGPVAGVKFVLVCAAALGMLGVYFLVRGQWGSMAGIVGAAVYGLSPYLMYVDPVARGAVPETFVIALALWLWWAFERLLRTTSSGDLILATGVAAAIILTHNLMSFVFLGLLGLWVVWELIASLARQRPGGSLALGAVPWRALGMVGVALLLGVGLTAFMWLPAWLERGAVQFSRAFAGPPNDLPFVSASELFAPAMLQDVVDDSNPQNIQFRLGAMQWVLGGLGIITLLGRRARQTITLFFALMAVVCVFLVLPVSDPVWNWPIPLGILQLPWRLLGPAIVAAGVLAGAATHWVSPWPRGQMMLALAAVAACLFTASPLLDPLPWTDVRPADLKRYFIVERTGDWGVGTTQGAEFLPVGVASYPVPQESLMRSYETGLVDKVDRRALPEGVDVTVLEHRPDRDRFRTTSPATFLLHIFTFYFPGWTAYVDGVQMPVEVQEPEGAIAIPVSAGTHEVLLRFEDTWPRQLGWMISGGAGADRNHWWETRLTHFEVPAQHQRFVRLENNIALLAFDLPHMQAKPSAEIPVTLYWHALDLAPTNLSVFVHVIGPDGQLWGQSDKLNPGDAFPTSRYPLDRWVRDEHLATLRPDAPPGVYTVRAGLWDRYTGTRMRILDTDGRVTDQDGVALTTTFIVQP